MIFKLTKASDYIHKEDLEKFKKLGFNFTECKISKLIYIKGAPKIEINSLEELMNFIKEFGQIVIDEDNILIYDDYIE